MVANVSVDIGEIDSSGDFLNLMISITYHHAMKVTWNTLPRKAWSEFHSRYGGSLQQSWAYGQAMATLGVQVHRAAVMDGRKLVALAQFIGRRYLGYISLASCTRGPVWSWALEGPQQAEIHKALRSSMPTRAFRVTLFSPNCTLEQLPPPSVMGMHRVMTGYSTVMLDLTQGEAVLRERLEGKWRNRLVKAEAAAGLSIHVLPDRRACEKLLVHEGEQRQIRRFQGLPTGFVSAYLDGHEGPEPCFLVAWAELEGKTIASMLFLRHGPAATYHMGWSDEEGRKLNAHALLLWRGMLALKTLNIRSLDLGGVNTHDLPGISRFKLATGGQVLTLAGTYF